jgi:aminoglycoside phosphotransferase (APT) family kinase protein
MRDHWPRSQPTLDLDFATVEGLIAPMFPGCRIIEMAAVAGGLTNTNFRLRLADRPVPLLLRFYQRSGDLAHKEMAICHLVEKAVPVPPYLHFAPENPVTGHAFALMDWIEAEPLETLLPALDASALSGLGTAIGRTLAAIHGFTYEFFGFFDANLNVPKPIDLSRTGLIAYLHECLVEGLGGARLGEELTADVLAFAEREGHRVEAWQQRACLVHGDFNASNILIRQNATSAAWKVAGIIDWEFAFAGAPGFDFGSLLRPPLDGSVEFIAGLEQGYRVAGGDMPTDWRRIARITDLFSFADILHHPETSGTVIEDAKCAIRSLVEE